MPTLPSPSSSPTTGGPNATVVAPFDEPIAGLTTGDGMLFALLQLDNNGTTQVARIDPQSGDITTGPRIRGGLDLAFDAGSLWMTGEPAHGTGMSKALYRIDPTTLVIRRLTRPPHPVGDLIATPNGLWVGTIRALYRVDPSTGRVAASVPVRMTVGRVAFDPANDLIYDSLHTSTDATVRGIEERDASDGTIVAATYDRIGNLAVNALAATPDGVWSAEPTGMMAGATLYRRSDLKQHLPGIGGSNGLDVAYVDGVLWLPDGGTGRLRCADPATGKVRTWIPRVGSGSSASYDGDVVAIGTTIYVGALNAGIVAVDAGHACGELTPTP